MGRRRWRVITIAAFLLFMIKDTQCQDENEFYYTPVERNFAQVQPPLFPNSRPTTYFDNGDNYRVAPTAQQPLFNEGHVRFPSPNYNQNPSPFQLPTGRSQSGTPYYLNQAEFGTPQRTRFRPALPYNFELHPASTKRPTVPQIHSVAYQNDPSKPETFLGQITLNNPDIDYLQNNRFKNIPFDSNSLKSNGQSGHIPHDEDIDDNQDIFEHHRVTTYNPNKLVIKQRLNIKPTNSSKLKNYDPSFLDDKINFQNTPNKLYVNNDRLKLNTANSQTKQDTSNENKAIHDLEPLLEDDISDISSFRELMKNNQGSFDVQVIKSNNSGEYAEDNKPDASSMNTDNRSKDVPIQYLRHESVPSSTTVKTTSTTKETVTHHEHDDPQDEETEDEGEYVEYYDDTEITEIKHTTTSKPKDTEEVTDIYDDYDTTEVPENPDGEEKENEKESFDVLVMKTNKTMVQDDNFKHFVDSTEIDATETSKNKSNKLTTRVAIPNEDITSIETPILRQEVVSVVTTKSVVNGTISIPDVTFAPSTSKIDTSSESSLTLTNNDNNTSVTTENWIVVASVQTSRSVSGARFLPFPTVEQEEKKQVLTDETDESGDYIEETVTKDPKLETVGIINSSSSTENLNDKLDTIQSELSSSVLTGSLNKENKNIELITESTTESTTTSTTTTTTTTTTPSSLNVFTLKSTQNPNTTEKSSPDPLPVLIKKFAPRITTSSTSTTPKPRKKPSFVTVMDDLAGFLPPGYKPRPSYKDKRTSTTSTTQKTRISTTARTTTTTTAIPESSSTEDTILNGTQGRSSGISFKNKVIVLDDKSLLPKEYKPKENEAPESLLKKIQNDDLSKFLPPGYKPPEEPETVKEDIFDKIKTLDISAFLPKGYNLTSSTTEKPKTEIKIPIKAATVDLSALLPPGFKLNSENVTTEKAIIEFKVPVISNLLPPGFSLNKTDEKTDSSDSSGENAKEATSTRAPGGSKLVFPTRLGAKPIRKNTTPKSGVSVGPDPVTPKILKGWPVRASTEFTGWPSPSTTPFSIEKLLEAQRNATATSPMPEASTEFTTRRSTTTTSTTTITPPPPTTPGICRKECDIAATIKIVSGVKWVPELLDHHTEEWQKLAKEVKNELNSVYSNSDDLNKWYKDIRIEGFTKGSVLVDYFIELNDVDEKVDTLQLKKLFHKSLNQASPGSVVEIIEQPEVLDPDVMLGDQPEEERMSKSNEKMTKTIDKSAGKLEIGKFVMDPAYTEFIVLPKRQEPTMVAPDEESFLPQWGIAVIVIALASLLFVVIFGVTVLVNRQKSAKAKQPIPLSEDMLRELDKSHMGGFDDLHQMKERELPYLPSGKRMSTAFIEQLAYPNPGDSWRSEWTPQLQKYMQHYTPDSGRGSQIYGQAGNGYGYGGGSQIYGQTGGGSQVYGYTGEYPVPRSHYSRRRSEYDSNF